MKLDPQCAKCPGVYCCSAPMEKLKKDTLPDYCPMRTSTETIKRSISRYQGDVVKGIYVPATITEKEAYHVVRGVAS